MKSKLLFVLTLVFSVFLSACSCNKFNIETYNSAVKNYEYSSGIDYNLVITEVSENSNEIISIESHNLYELSTTRIIENFASTTKKYRITTSDIGANGDPEAYFEQNRYYNQSKGIFYTIAPSLNVRQPENITYEEKYDLSSEYNIKNIIPVFKEEDISGFNIKEDKKHDGYSIATFTAACPAALSCDEKKIDYKVTIDKNYYFSKIEFTIVSGVKTSTYVYSFNGYNNDVVINFPSDLFAN